MWVFFLLYMQVFPLSWRVTFEASFIFLVESILEATHAGLSTCDQAFLEIGLINNKEGSKVWPIFHANRPLSSFLILKECSFLDVKLGLSESKPRIKS